MPAEQLAELTGLTTCGVTNAVDRLEKAGWVVTGGANGLTIDTY